MVLQSTVNHDERVAHHVQAEMLRAKALSPRVLQALKSMTIPAGAARHTFSVHFTGFKDAAKTLGEQRPSFVVSSHEAHSAGSVWCPFRWRIVECSIQTIDYKTRGR